MVPEIAMSKITDEEQNELDWIALKQKLRSPDFTPETGSARLWRKTKENPVIPIGCLATVAAFSVGLYSMKTANSHLSQLMMRARVAAQGFTILTVTAGLIYTAYQN